MGTFDGISVALSGLHAQRRAMDVAAQNVANANTVGYTRQRVNLTAIGASAVPALWSTPSTSAGGVAVSGVVRVQDQILTTQSRDAHALESTLSTSADALSSIESLFAEPSDNGLATQLSAMWSSFHDVANQPSDPAVRSQVLQRATVVTDWMNQASGQLTSQASAATATVGTLLTQVNTAAHQLADLNVAILRTSQSGESTNELADQRDQVALKLSELVGGTATTDASGNVNVRIGGSELVAGSTVRELSLVSSGGKALVQWSQDGSAATIPSGQVGGLVDAVNTTIPAWSARLDALAANVAGQVNALHQTGYDLNGTLGGPLFTGTTAATIKVAISDPRAIAASGVAPTAGAPSLDVKVADALGNLGGSTTSPDSVYRQLVSDLGIAAQSASTRVTTQKGIAANVDNAAASVAGVSIDEEMTNIITFQRAYEAAGRVLTAVDATLDTLINHTGLVGRA